MNSQQPIIAQKAGCFVHEGHEGENDFSCVFVCLVEKMLFSFGLSELGIYSHCHLAQFGID